jgi:uncharacterized protein YkwD
VATGIRAARVENKTMRRLVWLATLVVASLTFVVASPTARADGNDDAAFLADTNAERAKAGAQQLRMVDDLVAVAAKQVNAMAAAGRIYHNPNLTTDVRNWRSVAENVGRGADEPQIQGLLMASASHRTNILNPDFSEIGIATVRSGPYLYVAEVFRQPMPAAAPAPAPAPASRRPPPAAPRPAPVAAPARLGPRQGVRHRRGTHRRHAGVVHPVTRRVRAKPGGAGARGRVDVRARVRHGGPVAAVEPRARLLTGEHQPPGSEQRARGEGGEAEHGEVARVHAVGGRERQQHGAGERMQRHDPPDAQAGQGGDRQQVPGQAPLVGGTAQPDRPAAEQLVGAVEERLASPSFDGPPARAQGAGLHGGVIVVFRAELERESENSSRRPAV